MRKLLLCLLLKTGRPFVCDHPSHAKVQYRSIDVAKKKLLFNTPIHVFFFFENGNMNVTKRGQDGQDDQVR